MIGARADGELAGKVRTPFMTIDQGKGQDTPLLFHMPQTRSATILWMLEETGAPYDVHVFSPKTGEHRAPEYLAINPMGKVPALKHRGEVTTEVCAICAYLADAYPDARLAPVLTDSQRGPYLKWLFFYAGCIEPAVTDRSLNREPGPRATVGYGSYDDVVATLRGELEREKPFLTGENFTAADLVMAAALRWLTSFGLWPDELAFKSYVARCTSRPSAATAAEKDAGFVKQYGSPFDA